MNQGRAAFTDILAGTATIVGVLSGATAGIIYIQEALPSALSQSWTKATLIVVGFILLALLALALVRVQAGLRTLESTSPLASALIIQAALLGSIIFIFFIINAHFSSKIRSVLFTEPIITPTSTSTNNVHVIYRADWSHGLNWDNWPNLASWNTINGDLINDGTVAPMPSLLPAALVAPISLEQPNYSVDAVIKAVALAPPNNCNTSPGYGLAIRVQHQSGYWVGVRSSKGACNYGHIIAGIVNVRHGVLEQVIANTDRPQRIFDNTFHFYRVQVRGIAITFSIDGQVVAKGEDTQFVQPGNVGLWDAGVQIVVSSFKVSTL